MVLARDRRQLRQALVAANDLASDRASDVALVPTMGALHAGHRALLDAARAESRFVVMSLFVNPAQFDDPADLARYPRDEERDLALAAEAGVDVVFAPAAAELYHAGHSSWVEVEPLGQILEGLQRPGHFRGVATVVLKLVNLTHPRRLYVGAKDAQQAAVLRRMVQDLDLDLSLRVIDTVRDQDGLALSSRNALLSPEGRQRALALPRALAAGQAAYSRGEDALDAAQAQLTGLEVDYLELASLGPVIVLTAAVRVDGVRLIDNAILAGAW